MAFQTLLRWLGLRHRPPIPGGDELRSMSDRELADIGIGRSEIPAVMAAGDALAPAAPATTSRGTGARTGGSPAAFRAGLSA